MKIAVITFSFAQNWGAVLQAYSLVSYLNNIGHETKLIYYREFDNTLLTTIKSIRDAIADIILFKENIARVKKFNDFRMNDFILTPKCLNSEELKKLNSDFDAFIAGSDQIWNIGHGVCFDYYLKFADAKKRKISYAASFGVQNIPDCYKNDVKKGLENIDYISVREESGKKIVDSLIEKKAEIVLDPVFLLSPDMWNTLVGNERIYKEKYIFVYPTQITSILKDTVKYLKMKYKCKAISPFYIPGCITIKDIGPKDFVKYVRDAECIVASSFHATAFSIMYRKKLYVITHSNTGSRTTDLLNILNLGHFIVDSCDNWAVSRNYNNKFEYLYNQRILKSKEFLENCTKVE